MDNPYCLVAKNITKHYGKILALDNVDIKLGDGECLALLGSNGAGKTTLCEILEGLRPPDAGTIHFGDWTYQQDRNKILEHIGVQLQETALYKKYTVQETLELFASFYKHPLQVPALIKRLGLAKKATARIEHLSGGQKQAVYLGCALINKPKILFLDEPTTGLDPQARLDAWTLLESLKAEGCSIFLTTHYLEEASRLADRVAIIEKGKIVATGDPKRLVEQHCGHDHLQFRLQQQDTATSQEQIIGKLRTSLPWLHSLSLQKGKCIVTGDAVSSRINDLFTEAHRLNIDITELAIRSSTLEDVYLKMTGKGIDYD